MPKIIFICLVIIYAFVYLIMAAKTKKPFKTIILYSVLGLLGVGVVNLTAKFSGIYIPLNHYTLFCSTALGLPGTVGLLLIRILFL